MNQRMFINSYRMLTKLSKFRSQPKNSSHKCNFSDKPVKVEQVATPLEQQSPKELLRNVVFPSDFDKKLLVWAGRYKSVEDVPKKVTYEELYHSKNKCRIKAANGLMIATVIGCLVAIYLGKQARARGDTVQKMNIDWHKEVNRKMDEEEERKNHQSK